MMNNNQIILNRLSQYLNFCEKSIDDSQIKAVTACGVSIKEAYILLLQEYLNLDYNFKREYLEEMVNIEDPTEYQNNQYYKDIIFKPIKINNWDIKYSNYEPYELFVRDDFKYNYDKVLPQLGFFTSNFRFPAIYENDILWMSVTPNEINTMKEPIDNAFGKVLTFGLGLGYYSYMVSLKNSVESVTIVEKDQNVINLFNKHILPLFKTKAKINIINMDAYDFLEKVMKDGDYDFVFVDIYHDAKDGLEVYKKISTYEKKLKNITFSYWIKKTLDYYLNN